MKKALMARELRKPHSTPRTYRPAAAAVLLITTSILVLLYGTNYVLTLGDSQLLGGDTGSVWGYVLSRESEEPLPGAVVHVAGTEVYTLTDERGRYSLKDVPRGEQRLQVYCPGRVSADVDTYVLGGSTPEILEPLNISLKKGALTNITNSTGYGALTGTVRDAMGNPVPGACVKVGGQTAYTGGSGRYSISNVPAGEWVVSFSCGNYTSLSVRLYINSEENRLDVALSAGSGNTSMDLTSGSAEIMIHTSPHAVVHIMGQAYTADSTGTVRVDAEPGITTMECVSYGTLTTVVTRYVNAGEMEVTIDLEPGASLVTEGNSAYIKDKLATCGPTLVFLGIFVLSAGIYSAFRRNFRFSLVGSIAGVFIILSMPNLFIFFLMPLGATILIYMAREEFR